MDFWRRDDRGKRIIPNWAIPASNYISSFIHFFERNLWWIGFILLILLLELGWIMIFLAILAKIGTVAFTTWYMRWKLKSN